MSHPNRRRTTIAPSHTDPPVAAAAAATASSTQTPSNASLAGSASSALSMQRNRQYAHLAAQLAALNANLADTENLLRMTACQAEVVRGLGGWMGGLYVYASCFFSSFFSLILFCSFRTLSFFLLLRVPGVWEGFACCGALVSVAFFSRGWIEGCGVILGHRLLSPMFLSSFRTWESHCTNFDA